MRIYWFFSSFQTLSFSQLKRIFTYLSTTHKNEVIKEFCTYFVPKNKKNKLKEDSFLNLLNMLSNLRNVLMHNGCIIKIKHKDIHNDILEYFNIEINNDELRLNEMIMIMESIIGNGVSIFNEINDSTEFKFKNRTKRNKEISKLFFDIVYDFSNIKLKI